MEAEELKIGILTFHRASNYGAFLQAFALSERLNQEPDIEAEVIDFRMKKEKDRYQVKWSFKRHLLHPEIYFFEKRIQNVFEKTQVSGVLRKTSDYLESDSLDDFKNFVYNRYDFVIAGSDEIWKLGSFRGFPNPYWLFGDLGAKKASYAASSRSDFDTLSSAEQKLLTETLKEFKLIGVRDKQTYFEIKRLLGDDSKLLLCPDPTFVFDFPHFLKQEIHKEAIYQETEPLISKLDKKKKLLLVMTEDKHAAEEIKKVFGNDYNLVGLFVPHAGYINYADISPLSWISVIAKADLIITSYFHATCFSIIFNKSFIAFGTKNKTAKVVNLLQEMHLENHYVGGYSADFRNKLESKYIELGMESSDYSGQVLAQREIFDRYLKGLRDNEY